MEAREGLSAGVVLHGNQSENKCHEDVDDEELGYDDEKQPSDGRGLFVRETGV